MDLEATKQKEKVYGGILIVCIFVIACIEMSNAIKLYLLTLLAWGYCFAVFVNRDMKAKKALKELEWK